MLDALLAYLPPQRQRLQNHFYCNSRILKPGSKASFVWTRVLARAEDDDDGGLPPQSPCAPGEVYSLSFTNSTKLALSSPPPLPILIFIRSTLIHCVSPHKLMWLLPYRLPNTCTLKPQKNPIRSLPSSTAMVSPNPKPQKLSDHNLNSSYPTQTNPFCSNSIFSTPKALLTLTLSRS